MAFCSFRSCKLRALHQHFELKPRTLLLPEKRELLNSVLTNNLILDTIFNHLDYRSLNSAIAVCKKFNEVGADKMKHHRIQHILEDEQNIHKARIIGSLMKQSMTELSINPFGFYTNLQLQTYFETWRRAHDNLLKYMMHSISAFVGLSDEEITTMAEIMRELMNEKSIYLIGNDEAMGIGGPHHLFISRVEEEMEDPTGEDMQQYEVSFVDDEDRLYTCFFVLQMGITFTEAEKYSESFKQVNLSSNMQFHHCYVYNEPV